MRTKSGLTYEVFGSGGQPIVACPCWSEIAPTVRSLDTHWLRRLAQDQTLAVINHRGLAGSSGLADLDNEVLGLREVADEVGSPAILLGGCEAAAAPIALAARHPDRVRALIVINGSARMTAGEDYPGRRSMEAARTHLAGIRRDWEKFVRTLLEQVAPIPWTDVDSALRLFRQFVSPDALATFVENFVLADVLLELSRITAPTLVIHSTEDEVILFAQAQYLAAHVPGAKLRPLQGARHHIDPSYNEEVARTVTSFLAGLN